MRYDFVYYIWMVLTPLKPPNSTPTSNPQTNQFSSLALLHLHYVKSPPSSLSKIDHFFRVTILYVILENSNKSHKSYPPKKPKTTLDKLATALPSLRYNNECKNKIERDKQSPRNNGLLSPDSRPRPHSQQPLLVIPTQQSPRIAQQHRQNRIQNIPKTITTTTTKITSLKKNYDERTITQNPSLQLKPITDEKQNNKIQKQVLRRRNAEQRQQTHFQKCGNEVQKKLPSYQRQQRKQRYLKRTSQVT